MVASSLDAELAVCGMLMDNLCHWIDNCVRQKDAWIFLTTVVVSFLLPCIFRWHASHAG